ncbi:triose-phosphate isomerase [Candidatus Micrarchaeota archaeon]|nr:triose-phosphate isomerase [Candidatus Micrarchaeota archaeon]
MIVLNLKNYPSSLEKITELTEAAKEINEETGVRVIVCPPVLVLKESAGLYPDVFAQHADGKEMGARTGWVPVGSLRYTNAKGSLVNHSEHRIPMEEIKTIVEKLKENNLESLVCAENPDEIGKISILNPDYIAVEPPELIGSGISISNSKPELITDSLKKLKELESGIPLLCGAGVSNREDVENALKLGSKGVLLASAYVKAEDHKEFLRNLASAF